MNYKIGITNNLVSRLVMIGIFVILICQPLGVIHGMNSKENTIDDLAINHVDVIHSHFSDITVKSLIVLDAMQSLPTSLTCLLLLSQDQPMTIHHGKLDIAIQHKADKFKDIRGKTYDILKYLIDMDQPIGIREIQRHFEYSSPNLVTYHLKKLYNLDLVIKTPDNRYQVNPNENLSIKSSESTDFSGYINLLAIVAFLTMIGAKALIWSLVLIPFSLYQAVKQIKR